MKTAPIRRRLLLAILLLTSSIIPARADISFVEMFRNNNYLQTGNGAAINYQGAFLTLGLTSSNGNEFTSVSASYPGPASPVTLSQSNAMRYDYSTDFLASQSVMDMQFPTGNYQFTATGAGGPASTSFSYTTDYYPQTLPYVAGSTYSNLQGLNSSASFTFQLSPFTPNAGATESYIFLSVFETDTGNLAFQNGFLPSNTTSINMPANTLTPGTAYTYEMIYSDRKATASPGAEFDAQVGFDLRTDGNFMTAAVPEPQIPALLVAGVAVFFFHRKRRAVPA